MADVNWALALPQSNLAQDVTNSFQQGQQTYEKNAARAALSALVQDPTNPRALAALAKISPEIAMQYRQQQAQLAKEHFSEHAESIKAAGEIVQRIKAANPSMPDEQVYQLARTAAIQQNIPGAELAPAQFDQGYFNGLLYAANALKDANDPKIITPQPGGGAFSYDQRTGQITPLIQPNESGQPMGAPATPSAQPLTDEQIRAMKGGQPARPAATFPGPH